MQQSAIPAGWYPDPTQPGAQRWWSGLGWTEHVHEPEPEPAQVPAAPAAPTVSEFSPYVPFQSNAPGTSYATQSPVASAHVSNTSAWLSFGLGLFAFGAVVVYLVTHPTGWIVTTTVVTSIVWGVRALILRSQGRATVLWAPIAGIALGATAGLIMLAALAGVFVHNTVSGAQSSVTGAIPDSVNGVPTFPGNPELSALLQESDVIERELQSQHAVTGAWPASLAASPAGTINGPDGATFGQLQTGWTIEYHVVNGGTDYEFVITGTTAGDKAGYSTAKNSLLYDCDYQDCNVITSSVAPNA